MLAARSSMLGCGKATAEAKDSTENRETAFVRSIVADGNGIVRDGVQTEDSRDDEMFLWVHDRKSR